MDENMPHANFADNPMARFEKVWMQIGKITAAFASIESRLSSYIIDLIDCGYGVGMVLVGGKRWDDLWKLLIDLMSAKKYDKDLIEYTRMMWKKTGEVKKYRDIFAHYKFSFSENKDKSIKINFHPSNPRYGNKSSTFIISFDDLHNIEQYSIGAIMFVEKLHGILNLRQAYFPDDMIAEAFLGMPPLPPLPGVR